MPRDDNDEAIYMDSDEEDELIDQALNSERTSVVTAMQREALIERITNQNCIPPLMAYNRILGYLNINSFNENNDLCVSVPFSRAFVDNCRIAKKILAIMGNNRGTVIVTHSGAILRVMHYKLEFIDNDDNYSSIKFENINSMISFFVNIINFRLGIDENDALQNLVDYIFNHLKECYGGEGKNLNADSFAHSILQAYHVCVFAKFKTPSTRLDNDKFISETYVRHLREDNISADTILENESFGFERNDRIANNYIQNYLHNENRIRTTQLPLRINRRATNDRERILEENLVDQLENQQFENFDKAKEKIGHGKQLLSALNQNKRVLNDFIRKRLHINHRRYSLNTLKNIRYTQ